MARTEVDREDVAAALAARRELGKELEPEVIEAFLDRIATQIDRRVDERLAEPGGRAPAHVRPSPAVPILSLVFAIPLTGIADGSLLATVVVWVAIVAINVAHAAAARR